MVILKTAWWTLWREATRLARLGLITVWVLLILGSYHPLSQLSGSPTRDLILAKFVRSSLAYSAANIIVVLVGFSYAKHVPQTKSMCRATKTQEWEFVSIVPQQNSNAKQRSKHRTSLYLLQCHLDLQQTACRTNQEDAIELFESED